MDEYLAQSRALINDELHLLCRRYQAIPLAIDQQTLTVAVAGTVPDKLIVALRFASGRKILIEEWPAARLEQGLNQLMPQATAEISDRLTSSADEETTLGDESDTPAVQFINQTLYTAIQRRASDIHFEPYQQYYRIRLRIH